jgi:hypothetical protein
MNILAVDPGSKLGWALSMAGTIESGVEDFSLRRGESPGARFLRFRKWLADITELCTRQTGQTLHLIAYEQPHHRGGHATEVACGFSTRLQEHAAGTSGCECVSIHTATLKKRATGSGRAGKPEMIAAARERWSLEPTDDNHADALCILAWALDQYGDDVAQEASA